MSMRTSHPRPALHLLKTRRPRGLTLIELMIAVAILGILSAMAYPSYAAHLSKGRRADARAALLDVAQRMERYYTERGTYIGATLGSTGVYPAASSQGYYTMALSAQTLSAFTVTATPTGVQSSDACGRFNYNQAGTKGVGGGATLSATACW